MAEISSPTGTFKIRLASVVLDSSDSKKLADFYAALLNWQKYADDPEWIYVRNEEDFPLIIFQQTDDYVPPVWPNTLNQQQTGAHLDFGVSNLKEAVEHAIQCGAKKAEVQYSDRWTVMLDPANHPFCLVEWKNLQ
jgi:catechol-2,3-dioxygenase